VCGAVMARSKSLLQGETLLRPSNGSGRCGCPRRSRGRVVWQRGTGGRAVLPGKARGARTLLLSAAVMATRGEVLALQ